MSARAVVPVAVAGLLLVLGCGHGAGVVHSGVQGIVLVNGGRAPQPQSVVALSPYPRPYVFTEISATDSSGVLVAKVDAGPDGRFRIALPPGRYELDPRPTAGNPGMSPLKVTITRNHFTSVVIWADEI